VIDSNQYGEGAAVAKADEALPVGLAYITAGAKEEVADETTDETWKMETWAAATGLVALSRAIAR
jgi:hypothetical protein